MKASTYEDSGSGLHETNILHLIFNFEAKRSISGDPNFLHIKINLSCFNWYSVSRDFVRDAESANLFSLEAMYDANM